MTTALILVTWALVVASLAAVRLFVMVGKYQRTQREILDDWRKAEQRQCYALALLFATRRVDLLKFYDEAVTNDTVPTADESMAMIKRSKYDEED